MFFCTSFLDEKGLKYLLPTIHDEFSNKETKSYIYSNGEAKYTRKKVREKLKNTPEIEHKVICN